MGLRESYAGPAIHYLTVARGYVPGCTTVAHRSHRVLSVTAVNNYFHRSFLAGVPAAVTLDLAPGRIPPGFSGAHRGVAEPCGGHVGHRGQALWEERRGKYVVGFFSLRFSDVLQQATSVERD